MEAPRPPAPPLLPPPCAPKASIVISVTPAGTTNESTAPVYEKVCDPETPELQLSDVVTV
ncbi:hypothetical protein AEQU3_02626 [Aequorivita antarctica]|nr:hypothetical protein AEQU3_02626 [Aequorivita antarctica]